MPAPMLAGPLTILERGEDHVVTATDVRADDPVFAGHYPGFPIFPGVFLVECAHQSALLAGRLRGRPVALAAVQSARFHTPAYPDSQVVTSAEFTERDGMWHCTAKTHSNDVELATVRLRLAFLDQGEH